MVGISSDVASGTFATALAAGIGMSVKPTVAWSVLPTISLAPVSQASAAAPIASRLSAVVLAFVAVAALMI